MLGTGLGTLIGLFLLSKKLLLGEAILLKHGPLLLMAMVLILSGIQFLSIGLIGEMLARTYYETQKKPIYAVREIKTRRRQTVEESVPEADSPRA